MNKLPNEEFRRSTRVKRGTFDEIIKILEKIGTFRKKARGGRPNKLNLEETLLQKVPKKVIEICQPKS